MATQMLPIIEPILKKDDSEDLSKNQKESLDILSKYKRLLIVARKNIEEDQRIISEKDQTIARLQNRLKLFETSSSNNLARSDSQPSIIARYESANRIWILIKYAKTRKTPSRQIPETNDILLDDDVETDNDEVDFEWLSFRSRQQLSDYMLAFFPPSTAIPHPLLSQEESDARSDEISSKKIDKLSDSFRKYRINAELAIRQRDNCFSVSSSPIQSEVPDDTASELNSWKRSFSVLARENEEMKQEMVLLSLQVKSLSRTRKDVVHVNDIDEVVDERQANSTPVKRVTEEEEEDNDRNELIDSNRAMKSKLSYLTTVMGQYLSSGTTPEIKIQLERVLATILNISSK